MCIDLTPHYDRHCRFKLRSGKEVFGVIWEVTQGAAKRLHFASVQDYQRYRSGKADADGAFDPVDPNEIVAAERLAS